MMSLQAILKKGLRFSIKLKLGILLASFPRGVCVVIQFLRVCGHAYGSSAYCGVLLLRLNAFITDGMLLAGQ